MLPLSSRFLPGVFECMGKYLVTYLPLTSMSVLDQAPDLVTLRGPVFAHDSSDTRSSPNHGQLARSVPASRSPVISVTSRFAALVTSRRRRDVAFPPYTMRDRDCTDRRMSQL